MAKLTKKEINVTYTDASSAIFACPHCGESMVVSDMKSIICSNNHTYDFAKQGYLNFLASPMHIKYSRDLFTARKQIIADEDFFAPLSREIIAILDTHFPRKHQTFMLDAGCGEGSHLAKLKQFTDRNVIGVGIDIAKEAILEAAKNYDNFIWTVGDLVHTPFQADQFDVILNILSPANNAEFKRLLTLDGIIIKVVPSGNYLREIREYLFKDQLQETYSNTDVVEHFSKNFELIDKVDVTYRKHLHQSALAALIKMTPLTWDMTAEQADYFKTLGDTEITVDLEILVGRKR